MRALFGFAVLLAVMGCTKKPAVPDAGVDAGSADAAVAVEDAGVVVDAGLLDAGVASAAMLGAPAPGSRLKLTNACAQDVWIQQTNYPASVPAVQLVKAGATISLDIPPEGLAATRLWPKLGCDASGQNCLIGQSSPPCPTNGGCAPPVDSKLEATWGCMLADKSKCAVNPSAPSEKLADTWWNASAVDGYTFSFTIAVKGGDGRKSCAPVDCSGLSQALCPSNDDLSTNGSYPKYSQENLAVIHPTGGIVGCYSPCMKLNYPTFAGEGIGNPQDLKEQMYCCPTPPITSPQCIAGPVPQTKYVKMIHEACKGTTYAYAYDDVVGLRNCSPDTVIEMTIGPSCPKLP